MTAKTIQLIGSELTSRRAAVPDRLRITALAGQGDRVVLDFSAVATISESYADELLGVLVAQNGLQWLAGHVSAINVSDEVISTLARAIDRQCAARGEDPVALAAL